MVFSSTTIPSQSQQYHPWDPATASHTPASRGYHSSHDDSFRHPQPLAYEFPSRAASPLEIWGIATGTCFLAALLCWLLWVALCTTVGSGSSSSDKKNNTTYSSSSSSYPLSDAWRTAPRGGGGGGGGGRSNAPAAAIDSSSGNHRRRRRTSYAPDSQQWPPASASASAFRPRLFLAGLKTANASAEELLGAERRRSSMDKAAGPLRHAVSTTSPTASSSSSSSSPTTWGPGVRPSPRATDIEEGFAGPSSSASSPEGEEECDSRQPQQEEEEREEEEEEGEDMVVVDIGDGGREMGNGDGSRGPFLRRKGKGRDVDRGAAVVVPP
ncbi:hypothetical protein F5X96DRAFT_665441 [Biscogniauxia mediterranea]|nr:hypothetical protein F5X96DRAFT_665441 [Biscogniauxia mediterranea]